MADSTDVMSHNAAQSGAMTSVVDDKGSSQDGEPLDRRRKPDMYLVITNISKRANVRALLSTAAAFGCKKVLVVGQKSFDIDSEGPDIPGHIREHVKLGGLPIQRFASWEDCTSSLRERKIRLVGVEIHKEARPIESFLDMIDTAFLMGNEGQGLSIKQMDSCDAFVRVPQYGGGTASLNVYVATGIILHRFHHWQRYLDERKSEADN